MSSAMLHAQSSAVEPTEEPSNPSVSVRHSAYSGLRVTTLKTVESIQQFRETWSNWHEHPNTDLDFYLIIVGSRAEVVRPHVIVVYRDEQPIAMMVGREEDVHFDLKLGYWTVCRPKARVLRILYGGVLGDSSLAVQSVLAATLKECLARREVEIVALDYLRPESSLHQELRQIVSPWRRDLFPLACGHWGVRLPGSYDEYLHSLSKNRRKSIRTRAHRLQREFGDSLTLKRFAQPEELDEMLRDMETVAAKTYQRRLGVGFKNDGETRRIMEWGLRTGRLHTYVLYLKGKPVAFDKAMRYQDALFLRVGGYDPDFAAYGLGTYLICIQIEEACNSRQIRRVDMGFGDADYKEALGNEHWREQTVHIFTPTLKGVTLNLLKSAFSAVRLVAQRGLKGLGVFEKVRGVCRHVKLAVLNLFAAENVLNANAYACTCCWMP